VDDKTDFSYREEVVRQMRHDIEFGKLDKFKPSDNKPATGVSFAAVKKYGLTTDTDRRWVQHQLRNSGHVIRRGNRFLFPARSKAA